MKNNFKNYLSIVFFMIFFAIGFLMFFNDVIKFSKVIKEDNTDNNTKIESYLEKTIDEKLKEDLQQDKQETKVEESDNQTTEDIDFSNTLFIGDSRSEGLFYYAPIEGATYFAVNSLDVHNIDEVKAYVKGTGQMFFKDVLKKKKFDRVIIMLGVNQSSIIDMKEHVEYYFNLLDRLIKENSDMKIYCLANLYISKNKDSDKKFWCHNSDIRKFNECISMFQNDNNLFYIDSNFLFDDGEYNLREEFTSDGIHLRAMYYKRWSDYIKSCINK